METILLTAAIALAMAFFMLWFRQMFLSFGKKRKPKAALGNIYGIQSDDNNPDDDLTGIHDDTAVIQVEEFLAKLSAKARDNTAAAVKQHQPDGSPSKRNTRHAAKSRRLPSIKSRRLNCIIGAIIIYALSVSIAHAQQVNASDFKQAAAAAASNKPVPATTGKSSDSGEQEQLLLERIDKLERRLAELESRSASEITAAATSSINSETTQPAKTSIQSQGSADTAIPTQVTKEDRGVLDFFRDMTINLTLDGYYGYNFNKPTGRINLLRAYDVMSNSFSLNQAAVIIERAPNVASGRRFGLRLDLQYGQATETLQGSAANELRPQVYRPVFQAYGTYVAPVGSGLTLDFGKWASAFGIENNYTKDQMNYSRSYYFNFLPFYHFGFRSTYNVNNKLSVTHWLVNGIQQSEDFNGFKSQAILLNLKPTSKISWNVNYYTGLEGRDTESIRPVPHGRTHIFDTYATINATGRLTIALEGDYVINRVTSNSPPSHISGGAAYARYQFTPLFALAGRAEYLSDRGGLFSGVTQALKETTLTADFKLADGFLLRSEWRRDFSNKRFFLTEIPDALKKEQNTATLGLIWWVGRKEGSW